MLFSSKEFAIFFTIIFCLHWLLPWARVRVYLLLVASFYFYAAWNKELALLVCISTVMDYFVARGMDRYTSQPVRRLLLVLSLVANLGLLFYFKYANFFLDSLRQTLQAMGAEASFRPLQVILPIGISFYTFEAINYTIDVYRKKTPAEKNLANFMLFILFFPHLVAGPIVRARDFLPQVRRPKRWDWIRLQLGVQFFVMGLFKKWAIADRMAMYADPVFAAPEQFGTSALWLGTLAYALQIYCDFSGYTDMAIGTAHMLVYKLAQNFNMPYLACNVSDFWRRWHISLSSWLRDYLFIPLGGSRGGEWATCRNLMLTMVLGGLWHGANWTFVIWGFLHGLLLILHRIWRSFSQRVPALETAQQSPPGVALRMAITFVCVCLCWVFFRAQTLPAALTMVERMVVPSLGNSIPMHPRGILFTVAVVALCHVLAAHGIWKRVSIQLPAPVLGASYAMVMTLAMVLSPEAGKAFIYFQF